MSTQHPLSLGEVKRLAGSADTIRLRAVRDADLETPIGAFLRLDDGMTPAYLLESVEGGERLGRYSFLGVGPRRLLEVRDGGRASRTRPVGVIEYTPDLPVTDLPAGDPLAALRAFVPRRTRSRPTGCRASPAARWAPSPTTPSRLRAAVPLPDARSRRRPAGELHRDRPRHRLRPPDPHSGRDRLAPHRRASTSRSATGSPSGPSSRPSSGRPARVPPRSPGPRRGPRAGRRPGASPAPRPRGSSRRPRWDATPSRRPSGTPRTPSRRGRRSRSSWPGARRWRCPRVPTGARWTASASTGRFAAFNAIIIILLIPLSLKGAK